MVMLRSCPPRFIFHLSPPPGGCRHSAYTCICACGPNSAILHYGHAGAHHACVVLRCASQSKHMVICVQERPTSACCRRTISPCWTWAPSGLQRDACVRFAHAAGRYYCYCSDITCSYPVSRTFSPDQRFVYEIVLEAQKQILGAQPCRSDCAAAASSVAFCLSPSPLQLR